MNISNAYIICTKIYILTVKNRTENEIEQDLKGLYNYILTEYKNYMDEYELLENHISNSFSDDFLELNLIDSSYEYIKSKILKG